MLPAHRLGPKTVRINIADLEALKRPVSRNEAMAEHVRKTLESAPTLSDEQLVRIADILRGTA